MTNSTRTSLSGVSVPNEPRSPPADLSGTQGRLSLDSEYSIPPSVNDGYYPSPTSLGSMNQAPYMDVHASHMSSAQSYACLLYTSDAADEMD